MALKLKDIISNDVHALITALTGFEKSEENFKACERYILSNLIHHRFLSVDSHAVRRSLDGMVMKFHVHGLSEKGQQLDSLTNEFLASLNFKGHQTVDIQWSLLSLLLYLGENPTSIVGTEGNLSVQSIAFDTDSESDFDWAAYLKEGEEEFDRDWNVCSSEEDEVDCMVSMPNESIFNHANNSVKDALSSVSLPNQEIKKLRAKTDQVNAKQVSELTAQRFLSIESWFRNNVQPEWYSKDFITHKVLSKHPYANSAYLCEASQKDSIKSSVLSEHKVVLESIWLLSTQCDTAVFMRVISDDGLESHFCVRPHVTVPSLIQDVFSFSLNTICIHASMLEELQLFCSGVHECTPLKKACATYQTYACALQHELKPVFEVLAQLEQRAHSQRNTLTLLVLMQELAPSLSTISALHKLHISAVLDWKQHPNWLCATHLLSVLLVSLQCAGNVAMNFRIFVQTFQVYLKIIELWLTAGQLYDSSDEFFILMRDKKSVRFPESNDGPTSFEMRNWEEMMASVGLKEPPQALQVLANCLLKAAEPLHILYELKGLPELLKHTSRRCSLVDHFLQSLICDLEACQLPKILPEDVKEDDPWWVTLDHQLTLQEKLQTNENVSQEVSPESRAVDVEAVVSHLHRLQEPLLMKDFQALFHHSPGILSPETKSEKNKGDLQTLLLLSRSMAENLSLESCVEKALVCLSADWEGIVGAIVADILIEEHQLLHHIHVAQSVFLLQSSHKLQPFLSDLFKLMLLREELNSYNFSVLLQDCLDSDQFTLTINSTGGKELAEMNSLDIIDSLNIKYQVGWPLCAILRDKSQSIYNTILHLLLKIRWGLWILEKLNVTDFSRDTGSKLSRRLFHLRYWLLNVMRGTYDFLAGHILNALWVAFEENVKCAKDLRSLIEVHNKFLDNVLLQSLYAGQPDPIKNALFQLVVLAEKLHFMWHCTTSEILLSKLSNMEACYAQCHRFLAASLQTLAEEAGLHHLVVLSDMFNSNVPKEVE